jgi:hypothetical protein
MMGAIFIKFGLAPAISSKRLGKAFKVNPLSKTQIVELF